MRKTQREHDCRIESNEKHDLTKIMKSIGITNKQIRTLVQGKNSPTGKFSKFSQITSRNEPGRLRKAFASTNGSVIKNMHSLVEAMNKVVKIK